MWKYQFEGTAFKLVSKLPLSLKKVAISILKEGNTNINFENISINIDNFKRDYLQ